MEEVRRRAVNWGLRSLKLGPAGPLPLRLRLGAALLAGLLWSGAGAAVGTPTTYTFGAWTFTQSGAEASTQSGLRVYEVPGGQYLFTPAEALGGRTLEEVATQVLAAAAQGQRSTVKLIRRDVTPELSILAYSGIVSDPATGAESLHTAFFFERRGQWGMALLIANDEGNLEDLVGALGTVNFDPEPLARGSSAQGSGNQGNTAQGAAQSGGSETPRLPALPWPSGHPDRTANSVLGLSFPAARQRGLNPLTDLLPDVFDCYFTGDDPRAMTPTPDLRVQVSSDGTYALNDGVSRALGRWSQTRGKERSLEMSGPLSARQSWIRGDDEGQVFSAAHTASGRPVLCAQAGPGADALRLELSRERIGSEAMGCQWAWGGPAFTVQFGNIQAGAGTYSSPEGSGRVRLAFTGSSGGNWEGLAEFSGGPFDLHTGEIEEDGSGNRELRVTLTTRQRSPFLVGSETTLLAVCRAKVAPKPGALYGRTPAPAPRTGGGPDGLFVSRQAYDRTINIGVSVTSLRVYEPQLSLFRPGGFHLPDVDPTELGTLPDCGRTRPNGDPFCERYDLQGGQLRFEDEDGEWDDPEPYRPVAGGFLIGETRYARLEPLTNAQLVGVYSNDDFSGSGPLGGASAGGAGNYSSLSNFYRFTAAGEFEWRWSSSTSTLISPNLVTGGVVGGGGSSRSDGGQGRYTLKDHWLTLNFSDGRVKRLFVYGQPDAIYQEDPSLGPQLNIGGSWLGRVR